MAQHIARAMAGSAMAEGARFYQNPVLAGKWVNSLPFTDVPTEYGVYKPWGRTIKQDEPELIFLQMRTSYQR